MASVQVGLRQVASVTAVSWGAAFLEWLDFYTYALLAGILARIFFPAADPLASLLAAFAAIAVGFLFRPLGALIFGYIGDRFGRKRALLMALAMLMAGTLGIGLLPGYAAIGVLASIAVFLLRIVQGLALGGGYGAAIVYLGEFVPEHRRGLFTGFLFTTPALALGTVGAIQWIYSTILGSTVYLDWGWRLVFITAAIAVVVIVTIIHLFYRETPVFSMLRTVRRVHSAPTREVFTRRYLPLVLLAWIGVVGAHGPVWYTNQLFNTFYVGPAFRGYVDATTAGALLATATYASVFMYLLFGHISDKIGRKPVLLLGIYGNALYMPVVFWLFDIFGPQKDLVIMWLLFYTMTLFNGVGYSGAQSAWLLELFPSRIRTSAVAFSYNLGYGVTGGLTPFVITWLYSVLREPLGTGPSLWWSVVIYSTMVPMVMASWFLLKGPETLGVRIWAEFTAEKFAKKAVVLPAITPIKRVVSTMVSTNSKYVVLTGGDTSVFGTRATIRALASGASLEEPAGRFAIKVPCIKAYAPVTEVFVALEQYHTRAVPICSEKGEPVGIVEVRELINEAVGLRGALKKGVALRVRAYDAVARELIAVKPETPLSEVVQIMAKEQVGFLPIEQEGKLVGIISETDIMRLVAIGNYNEKVPVAAVAKTKDIITASKDATLKDVAELMVKHNIRHVPVIEGGKVLGVISVRDILKVIG